MSGNLCISCNFCCNGTLFDYVMVSPAERNRLGGGDDFEAVNNGLGMRQRCVRLGEDGMCRAYDIRPSKCGAYDCDLVKAVAAGSVAEDTAIALLVEAKALRAEALSTLRDLLPSDRLPKNPNSPRLAMQALQDAMDDGVDIPADRFEAAKMLFLQFIVMIDDHWHKVGSAS